LNLPPADDAADDFHERFVEEVVAIDDGYPSPPHILGAPYLDAVLQRSYYALLTYTSGTIIVMQTALVQIGGPVEAFRIAKDILSSRQDGIPHSGCSGIFEA
jgi:hypothetical protein